MDEYRRGAPGPEAELFADQELKADAIITLCIGRKLDTFLQHIHTPAQYPTPVELNLIQQVLDDMIESGAIDTAKADDKKFAETCSLEIARLKNLVADHEESLGDDEIEVITEETSGPTIIPEGFDGIPEKVSDGPSAESLPIHDRSILGLGDEGDKTIRTTIPESDKDRI